MKGILGGIRRGWPLFAKAGDVREGLGFKASRSRVQRFERGSGIVRI